MRTVILAACLVIGGACGSHTVTPAPVQAEACWAASLPAAAGAIPPKSSVTDACAATDWSYPLNPNPLDVDDGWRVVGRWVPCGDVLAQLPAHAAIELGANGRWRLLAAAGSGPLVPVTGPGNVSGSFFLQSAVSGQPALLKLRGEWPDQVVWSGQVSFGAGGDALQLTDGSSPPRVYARTAGGDAVQNPPPTTDGRCSMAGTWDVRADADAQPPLDAAVFSFDGAGNFVGGPAGTELCSSHTMSGTYALSSRGFELVSSLGLGYCGQGDAAGYTAAFDASCNQLSLTRAYDECSNNRGYFYQPTTLTRRPTAADAGAPPPGDAAAPTFAPACWASQLPPPRAAPAPLSAAADSCAAAASAASWTVPGSAPEAIEDARSEIVGRWTTCGQTIAQLPAHDGIEFGANGRWRLLALDPADGTLVPVAAAGPTSSGSYHALTNDGHLHSRPLILFGELPSETSWTFYYRFPNQDPDAIRLDDQPYADSGGFIYARVAASSQNGADNPPPTADGACSMAGTWDVVTKDDPLGAPPAVMAFDDAGNFIGGPAGANLCQDIGLMYGTYALDSGVFELITARGASSCGWWMPAVYAAAFDPTCSQLSVRPLWDACNLQRGYFDQPTTLTRRVPGP